MDKVNKDLQMETVIKDSIKTTDLMVLALTRGSKMRRLMKAVLKMD